MIGFGYFKGMYDANIRVSLHDVVKPEGREKKVETIVAGSLKNAVCLI
jgi:hypothetical protein